MLPTLFVTKVPLEVPHDCGTALLITRVCALKLPFSQKGGLHSILSQVGPLLCYFWQSAGSFRLYRACQRDFGVI